MQSDIGYGILEFLLRLLSDGLKGKEMTSKENFEKTFAIVKENESKGKVTIMTECGLMSCNVEGICKQGAEGLLYDLNRDEATTLTLGYEGMERWVNDYAVAMVIRHLISELEKAKRK